MIFALPCLRYNHSGNNPKGSPKMEEKVVLLAIGFFLTTVTGGALGFFLNRRMWKTQTEHTVYRASFDEGVKFLDELSELIGRRFFLLQRFLWAIEDGDPEKIRDREIDYFDVVKEWNYKYWRSRNKIRLLISEAQANRLLDYSDDNAGDYPHSIHYLFVTTHRKVIAFKADANMSNEANSAVVQVNWACSTFLERLTTEFLAKATALQLLRIPVTPGGAELAAQRRADTASSRVHNS
jgi:hypothetical protein